jgi:hypothetical protein
VEWRNGRLNLQAWDDRRNLLRRVLYVENERPGRLELAIERFGKRLGSVWLVDTARPANQTLERRGGRLSFREQFRRFLGRQFPGYRIGEITTEQDLEHSLSPAYPRAFLKQGATGWAAIAAAAGADPDRVLSFGLIWLDYLRSRERHTTLEGLALFLPRGTERTTCLRIRYLNPRAARFAVFVYSGPGYEEPVDLADAGNLETGLERCRQPLPEGREGWQDEVCRLPEVERIARNDGSLSLRVRGLEFARLSERVLSFGVDRKRTARQSHQAEIAALAAELARMRSADSCRRTHPLYQRSPELWLESQVRACLEVVDATLLPDPVYGQVPAFAGGDRGVIDLLAADRGGRLAVLELKASEDLHLPLQALDYWMRVNWHLERGEFAAQGYFPGVRLSPRPPRLILVAPALDFHPTAGVLLRYFPAEIEVERIGLSADWRSRVKVMFRLRGAQQPV